MNLYKRLAGLRSYSDNVGVGFGRIPVGKANPDTMTVNASQFGTSAEMHDNTSYGAPVTVSLSSGGGWLSDVIGGLKKP
ncbi:MAG: hypothetical protein O3A01_06875 [bacterium]|nr:hypothetical protein [bacterium]